MFLALQPDREPGVRDRAVSGEPDGAAGPEGHRGGRADRERPGDRGDHPAGGDPLDRVGLERYVGAVEGREVLVVESRALTAQ